MRSTFLLLAGVLAALPAALPAPPSCKPEAPIELDVRLTGDPRAGCGIAASARSRTGHDVELEIVLPEGVTALGGERRGRGPRVDLRLDARAADGAGREILVRATIRDGSAVLTRVRSLLLEGPPVAPGGIPRRGSRGEPILEFGP
jgi:hypothetical protein